MIHPTFKRLRSLSLGLCLSVMSLGCEGDPLTAPADENPAELYYTLTLEHKAIVLSTRAPYDTVQLRAFPRSLSGDTMPHTGRIEYQRASLLDTSVTVDSTGFVRIRMSTPGTRIVARLTIGDVTRTDTATIVVRSESPVRRITRMEFFPLSPDSNWRWAGNTETINYERWVRLFDANGDSIPKSQVVVSHSWTNNLVVRSTVTTPAAVGEAYIRAHVYAYGTVFSDSILFRRIEPPVKFMVIGREFPTSGDPIHRFYPDSVNVKTGTTIIFMNANGNQGVVTSSIQCFTAFCGNRLLHTRAFVNTTLEWLDSTDVVFDNPAGINAGQSFLRQLNFPGFPTTTWPADGGTGNISAFTLMRCVRTGAPAAHDGCGGRMSTSVTSTTILDPGYRSRMFTIPGTYRFHSTRFPGATGVIVVHD